MQLIQLLILTIMLLSTASCVAAQKSEQSKVTNELAPGNTDYAIGQPITWFAPEFRTDSRFGADWVAVEVGVVPGRIGEQRRVLFETYALNPAANTQLTESYFDDARSKILLRAKNAKQRNKFFDLLRYDIDIEVSQSAQAYAKAVVGSKTIEIGYGLGYLIRQLSLTQNPHHQWLLKQSEFDFQLGRSRWFNSDRYRDLIGYASVSPEQQAFVAEQITMAILVHEVCHHYLGHSSIQHKAMLSQLSGDQRRKERRDNEIAADACAHEQMIAIGYDNRLGMFAYLNTSFFSDEDSLHPGTNERLTKLKTLTNNNCCDPLTDEAVVKMIEDRLAVFPMTFSFATLERVVEDYERGRWPECPFELSDDWVCPPISEIPSICDAEVEYESGERGPYLFGNLGWSGSDEFNGYVVKYRDGFEFYPDRSGPPWWVSDGIEIASAVQAHDPESNPNVEPVSINAFGFLSEEGVFGPEGLYKREIEIYEITAAGGIWKGWHFIDERIQCRGR